ncbi:uncharacterized protein LOC108735484 [Agrilus planipennis]|uniref:Uncharacterized protein LOC108735484 n=1 Tax=Agrilus planipennis TaxID=224129 RepID=A0A1W4WR50_AGRPL|nr:uncharacterized protein LOC108735484 [Agrilus planipennis]
MNVSGKLQILVLCFCFINITVANVIQSNRSLRSFRLPFPGFGPVCNTCPNHFCDDDPAVIDGYCCGCARFYDNLPIICPPTIVCPKNGYSLCKDYEYMMHCCC